MSDPLHSHFVRKARIKVLNHKGPVQGKYVLYWMQQSQRAEDNHALEYAIEMANILGLPVVVVFGLTDNYPSANLRHYTFMLEGLQETAKTLAERGIIASLQLGDPPQVALRAGRKAALLVCDRGYLRHQREWRRQVAREAICGVVQVESDVIVPVEAASPKAEYAARTIRPKLHKQLETYLLPVEQVALKHPSSNLHIHGEDLSDIGRLLRKLHLNSDLTDVGHIFRGGSSRAMARFRSFVKSSLMHYNSHSNQPQTDDISGMSPYLHFGQVSPIRLALLVKAADQRQAKEADIEAYLEELIVRRELAINFVQHVPDYDRFSCIPGWAAKTLLEHLTDPRANVYSREELNAATTHDPYWNAAMQEMKVTGFMHNYMRMYWGKKILEWSRTPEEAFQTTLELNNRYFLDGRDPNSYAGVAWIYGLHDRAWTERPVFGKVRYMAATGLERKCNIRAYLKKVDELSERAGSLGR